MDKQFNKTVDDYTIEQLTIHKAFFEFSPIGYCVLDNKGKVMQANVKVCELLGCTAEDLYANTIFNFLVDKIDIDLLGVDEHSYYSKTLNENYCQINIKRLIINRKKYILITVADLTQLQKAESELENLIRHQGQALSAVANGVMITNKKGNIVWVNQTFCDMVEYPPEALLGENPRILKSGLHPESFYDEMWAAISTGEVWFGQITNKTKSGKILNTKLIITPLVSATNEITHYIGIKQKT